MPLAVDRLIDIASAPLPAGGVCTTLLTDDRVAIRAAFWPLGDTPKGTCCIFPGRSEFIEKYAEVVGDLQQRGFAVAALDWRGQGGSERRLINPRKGHVDDFDQYLKDLDAFFSHLEAIKAPRPWFGIAHSMGGAILLMAAAGGERRLRRLVLSAPMVGIQGASDHDGPHHLANTLTFLGFGGFFVPGARRHAASVLMPFEDNPLTSDARRYDLMADRLVAGADLAIGAPTIGWVSAAFRLIRRMKRPDFGLENRIPMLFVLAGADRIVSTAMAEDLALRMRAAEFLTIPGARHEILFERDVFRDQFWAAFDAFIPGSQAGVSATAAA